MDAVDDLGELGEDLVARWLQQAGVQILARRWRCRWGELDLIARDRNGIQFVEVKARSDGSWDAGGLLAISARKQERLFRSATLFLSQQPNLAELPCRFCLALVRGQRRSHPGNPIGDGDAIALGQPIDSKGWTLTLQTYIPLELE